MSGWASPTKRRQMAKDAFKSAADTIGELRPGMAIFALTRGQFSMIDAVLHCLDQTGPAIVSIWTWTVADYEVETFTIMRKSEQVEDGRLIIDGRARKHCPEAVAEWQATHGPESVRYARNHAKIATIEGGGFRLLLRGSMNLNYNPRFEQFDITEGCEGFELVRQVEASLPVASVDLSLTCIRQRSGVGELFPEMKGIRVWTPNAS